RERRDDIPELVDYFLSRSARRLNQEPCCLESGAHDLLAAYHWPGNIRELENIMTRASVLNCGAAISADELRPWLISRPGSESAAADESLPVGISLEEMESK